MTRVFRTMGTLVLLVSPACADVPAPSGTVFAAPGAPSLIGPADLGDVHRMLLDVERMLAGRPGISATLAAPAPVSPPVVSATAPAEVDAPPSLGPVVVTASRTPDRIAETPDAISVVTAADLRRTNAIDLGGAMQGAPGVEVTPYGGAGTASSVTVRGSRPGQALVMLDGRPLNSPVTGDAQPSMVMTGAIDRIEVLRGPSALLYGSSALGGVVNVVTPRPPAVFGGGIDGQAGSFGTVVRRLDVGGPVGPTRWLLAEQRTTSAGARHNEAFRGESWFLKGEVLDAPLVTLTAGRWDSVQGAPGAQPAADPARRTASQLAFGDDDVSSLADEETDRRQFVDARAEWEPAPGHAASARAYGGINGGTFTSHFAGYGNPVEERGANTSQDEGVEGQYAFTPPRAGGSRLTLGGGWRKERLNSNTDDRDMLTDIPSHTPGIRGRVETGSAFAEWKLRSPAAWRGVPRLSLTGGARLDRHSLFGAIRNAHGGAAVDAGPVTFKLAGGTAFRAPTLSDLYWPPDAYGERGNPALKPERGTTYEAGLERRTDTVFVRVTTFSRAIRDQIDWGLDSQGGYYPTNVGRVTTRGDELEGSVRWRRLAAGGTITVLRAVQTQAEPVLDDVNPPYGVAQTWVRERFPAHVAPFLAAAHVSAALRHGTTLSLAAHGSGERLIYIPDSSAYPVVTTVTRRLPPFATATLRVSQRFGSSFTAYAGIENLTDAKYATHFGRTSFDPDNRDFPMPGRTFFAGASTTW